MIDGLITNAQNHTPTDNPQILKPAFGSVGTQYVEFRTVKILSGTDTLKEEKEVYHEKEVCLIKNDKFSTAAILPKDLSPEQKVQLAGLYEQFKKQKDSTDTRIVDWESVSDLEKGLLLQTGIHTVEQLYSIPDSDIYKLGPNGDDLKRRAGWHLNSKGYGRAEEEKTEMLKVLEENAKLKAQLEQREEAAIKAQVAKAEQEKAETSEGTDLEKILKDKRGKK